MSQNRVIRDYGRYLPFLSKSEACHNRVMITGYRIVNTWIIIIDVNDIKRCYL